MTKKPHADDGQKQDNVQAQFKCFVGKRVMAAGSKAGTVDCEEVWKKNQDSPKTCCKHSNTC